MNNKEQNKLQNNETVTISKLEYLDLLNSQELLGCLVESGVECWEGWTDAIEKMNGEYDYGDNW